VETAGNTPSDSNDAGVGSVYRLFHQALNDALLYTRADIAPRAGDEEVLTRAFTALGQASQWRHVPDTYCAHYPGMHELAAWPMSCSPPTPTCCMLTFAD
jgi:hypothetical protein